MRTCTSALLFLVGGCVAADGGGSGGSPDITNQVWEFHALDSYSNVARTARALIRGGASMEGDNAQFWRADFAGCFVDVEFAVQFNASSVTLLNFLIDASSTCGKIGIAQSFGNGAANAAFPDATTASGTYRLVFTTPLGQAGGDGQWRAERAEGPAEDAGASDDGGPADAGGIDGGGSCGLDGELCDRTPEDEQGTCCAGLSCCQSVDYACQVGGCPG